MRLYISKIWDPSLPTHTPQQSHFEEMGDVVIVTKEFTFTF